MAVEIINIDEIAKIAAATAYDSGHSALMDALRERYPDSPFTLVASLGPWSRDSDALVDAAGNRVTDHFRQWIEGEYHAAGDNANAVYEKHKDAHLRIVEVKGDDAIIVMPFNSQPDGYLQIEIEATQEVAERTLFDTSFPPTDLQDLLHPFSMASQTPLEISCFKYKFSKMTNIRRFCQQMVELDQASRLGDLPKMEARTVRILDLGESDPHITELPFLELYPDWISQPMKEIRFLTDWLESSAGRSGHRLCDHWWLKLVDFTYQGKRHMGFTPYWAVADGGLELPIINTDDFSSIFDLMSALEKFDKQTGYELSWFFYMVHGNRMGTDVGRMVVEALAAGKIGLPEWDKAVLLRWSERGYGF